MQTLKKLFPISWKYSSSGSSLAVGILIHLAFAVVVGIVISLVSLLIGMIPLVGFIVARLLGLIGGLIDIYVLAGIIIEILVFAKVIE